MKEPKFGHFLRNLRERRRMSLRDVEKECGVSNAYRPIGEWGQAPSQPGYLKKVCSCLQCHDQRTALTGRLLG
jgi:hypothetical protein